MVLMHSYFHTDWITMDGQVGDSLSVCRCKFSDGLMQPKGELSLVYSEGRKSVALL